MSAYSSRTYRYTQMRKTILAYNNVCHLCGKPGATEIDHLIPKAYGGTDTWENMLPAHPACNRRRGSKLLPSRRASRQW